MHGIQKLNTHPFFTHIRDALRPLLEELFASMPKERKAFLHWREGKVARLTRTDRYYRDVYHRTVNVTHVVERMEHSAFLIRRSPKAHSAKKHPLTRNEWTEYHFGVFTTALGSLSDSCLLLVAEGYHLGLLPKHCTAESVTDNRWVVGTAAAKAVRRLNKTLQDHCTRRNRYLHRGEQADLAEVTKSDWMYDLRMVTYMHSTGDCPDLDETLIRQAWKGELSKLRSHLDEESTAAIECVAYVFSALEAPMCTKAATLSG